MAYAIPLLGYNLRVAIKLLQCCVEPICSVEHMAGIQNIAIQWMEMELKNDPFVTRISEVKEAQALNKKRNKFGNN